MEDGGEEGGGFEPQFVEDDTAVAHMEGRHLIRLAIERERQK